MKKTVTISFGVLLVLALCLNLSGCMQSATETDVWSVATYTEDAEFGEGAKTVMVEVVAEEKSVTFTIHSDEEILGDALVAHGLIEGEQGAYGLYVKKVNGITADYDINGCYWGFNKNGEGMMTGVDGAEFNDGEHYELVYTK
ncbi:MAG: hypothetical protein IKW06_04015 [Clostridia bacterium]|nr:hypothetical protein [Clostridia bacterium]